MVELPVNFYERGIDQGYPFYFSLNDSQDVGLTYAGSLENLTSEYFPGQLCHAMTVTRIQVALTTAPGTGKSIKYTLRINQVETSLTVTVSGNDTSGFATGNISVSHYDIIDTRV